jgi:hypothetical protein
MPKPTTAPQELPRRRRWKIAKARSVLAELAASGLSLHEFASQQGLEPQRLRRWQRRLAGERRRPTRAPHPASRAVPAPPALIELRPTASARPAPTVEIVLASGVIVRVAETIDPATLARLVAAIEHGC